MSVVANRVKLRLHEGDSTKRAKPAGVAGATVFSYLGDVAPTDLGLWKFQTNTSRTGVELDLDPAIAPGTKVWLTAFWFNAKTQAGPAASPVSVYLGGGAVQQAA